MITVRVTEEHIKKGQRLLGDKCPVFLAMRDAGIPVTHITLFNWTTDPLGGNAPFLAWRNDLPQLVFDWIADFDNKKPVKPFDFELDYENKA